MARNASTQRVMAPLTQVASGLPIEADTCPVCEQPLRDGTPVVVQLAREDARPGWTIHTVRCRGCPHPPQTQSPHVLAGTLNVVSHAQTQTHELCFADPQPVPSDPSDPV